MNKNTGTSPVRTIKIHPFMVGVLVVIILGALGAYVFHVLINAIHEPPQAIFEQAFQTPLSTVSDLEGAGGWDMGYRYYLRFKSKDDVVLKHSKDYAEGSCEDARRWFLEQYPGEPGLLDNQHLRLLTRRKSTETSVMNQWLLYNFQTHDYFYRIWGFK